MNQNVMLGLLQLEKPGNFKKEKKKCLNNSIIIKEIIITGIMYQLLLSFINNATNFRLFYHFVTLKILIVSRKNDY